MSCVSARTGDRLSEYRNQIKAVVQSVSTSGTDTVPQQLLSKIDHIISLAEKDGVSTVKVSALFDLLSKACKYSCSASQDGFSLHESSVAALNNSDAAFKKFLSSRLMKEEDQAKEELESCEIFAEEAVREAKGDGDKLMEKAEGEESLATLDELEQTHTAANEMVLSEKEALTEDRDQFSTDVDRIDKLLSDLVVVMDQSDVEYAKLLKELKTEIFANQCRQEKMGEHLWRLEKKKGELETEMQSQEVVKSRIRSDLEEELRSNHGHQKKLREQLQVLRKELKVVEATASVEELLQDQADEEYYRTVEDFSQWREELGALHQQAETSLLIVDTMSECVQLIMEDAKKKKQDWQQALHDMKLKNLLQLRDSLMAVAFIHMMGVDDCRSTCDEEGDQITSNLGSSNEQGQFLQQQHRVTISRHEEKLKELQAELIAADGQIRALNPHLILDTLEDRHEKRRRGMRLVHEQNDVSAAEFCSHGNYSEQVRHTRRHYDTGEAEGDQGKTSKGRNLDNSGAHMLHIKKISLKKHQCNYCQKIFTYRCRLERHVLTHTGEKPHPCDYCEKTFATPGNLQRHVLTHDKEKRYKCDHCEKRFTLRSYLHRHLRTHSGKKPYQCDHCQRCFAHRKSLRLHILTHTGEKPHQCDYCKRRFAHLSSLRTHTFIHTGKPFQCDICGRKFARRGSLQKHVITHTDEKKYQCDHCQRKFYHHDDLIQHIRIHTEEKPYQCDYCQKKFLRQHNLKLHVMIHTREKPFLCDYCQKWFSRQNVLRAHILTHTKEKPYPCDYCKKRFTNLGNLKRHILIHTGEKPH